MIISDDPEAIRREFPILQERVHGKRLVWLDNAARNVIAVLVLGLPIPTGVPIGFATCGSRPTCC